MLNEATVTAMAAVKDMATAKQFYGEVLGLKQVNENMGGMMYQSGGGRIFVYQSPTAGTNQATTANWEVADAAAVVAELKAKGVDSWEHYEFPGAEHDGEIHIMGPFKSAWFKDPSGNILGITEVAAS